MAASIGSIRTDVQWGKPGKEQKIPEAAGELSEGTSTEYVDAEETGVGTSMEMTRLCSASLLR